MEEEKFQKELFEFEQPKKTFSRLTDILSKADFEGRVTVTLTLEKMVFIAIGIIMAMVIVYALGVESGKSRIKTDIPSQHQVVTPPALTPRVVPIGAKNMLNTAPVVSATKPTSTAVMPAAKMYTILAGSYAKRDGAQASAAVLVKLGFTVTITYSEPYYRVTVGSYASKNGADALKDMTKVKRIYKDAMFKLR